MREVSFQGKSYIAGRYSFKTFEEHLAERWNLSNEHVRSVIGAAEAAEKLHQLVEFLPSHESTFANC
jgi:hypothetical protein